MFKIGLLHIDAWLKNELCFSDANILLPVHDEFIIERKVQDSEKWFINGIISCMTDIPVLNKKGLKLRVDVPKSTTSWAEKVKIEI